MTRISKQERDRAVSPRRPRVSQAKTGSKRDALDMGYKHHVNAYTSDGVIAPNRFIPKMGSVHEQTYKLRQKQQKRQKTKRA